MFLPSFGFLFSYFPFSSLPHAHLSCVAAKFLKVSLLQGARFPQTSTVLLGQQAFACNCLFWKMLKAETKGWGGLTQPGLAILPYMPIPVSTMNSSQHLKYDFFHLDLLPAFSSPGTVL